MVWMKYFMLVLHCNTKNILLSVSPFTSNCSTERASFIDIVVLQLMMSLLNICEARFNLGFIPGDSHSILLFESTIFWC